MVSSQNLEVKPNVYAAICPSRDVLALIGEKWVSLIIGALDGRVLRFGELKRICEGISQKMLTQTLRKLERDGLVRRTVYAETLPIRADYELTELGNSLLPLVKAAKLWAEMNLHQIEKNRVSYDKRN
ncbi:helix-turn-helix transcriptional regulator [Oscillatoria sp. FACHB-1407]|uniref:winged helix-turn-helix transcriptional regulator n=1 Tax=Oscillatoria sp. FACHB-1407 TaxID=2692847 RepID=UPI0016885680|nr:helix-turn-helix domain-containing protein [Oscillatoria sp. FACHB-1407]MBD2464372.1 helix-turn-helix transcriptional regulator [Oscillatoria sp. FACHB-1407]